MRYCGAGGNPTGEGKLDRGAAARRKDDKDILLIVDVQNDFCPGGALGVPKGDAIIPAVNRLDAQFPHVVLTQDWHPRGHLSFAGSHPGRQLSRRSRPPMAQILWPDHCVQGTEGAAFHRDLAAPHAKLVLRKGFLREIDSYSAFRENDRRTPPALLPICANVALSG